MKNTYTIKTDLQAGLIFIKNSEGTIERTIFTEADSFVTSSRASDEANNLRFCGFKVNLEVA